MIPAGSGVDRGQRIFEGSGDFSRLSTFDLPKPPHPRALSIPGWESKCRFSKLLLTPATGQGERLR